MPAKRDGQPEPGTYKMRLVKDGVYVPCRIFLEDGERDPETGGLMSDQTIRGSVGDQDITFDELVGRWTFMTPIDEAEYDYLMSVGRYCAAHEPGSPEANPHRPFDINDLPPVF